DFAIESHAGDIFQLGNTAWRILQVTSGVVRVADAKGAPPTIPFWLGEAPARSDELSKAVSDLRADIEATLKGCTTSTTAGSADSSIVAQPFMAAIEWLASETGISIAAAEQIITYLAETHRALGVL